MTVKSWRRRKPASIPAEPTKAREPWPAPSEVIYEFWQPDSGKPGDAQTVKPIQVDAEGFRDWT